MIRSSFGLQVRVRVRVSGLEIRLSLLEKLARKIQVQYVKHCFDCAKFLNIQNHKTSIGHPGSIIETYRCIIILALKDPLIAIPVRKSGQVIICK